MLPADERQRPVPALLAWLPAALWPLACYLAMTIGVPLLNGVQQGSDFWQHALVVTVVAGGIVLLLALLGLLWQWLAHRPESGKALQLGQQGLVSGKAAAIAETDQQ